MFSEEIYEQVFPHVEEPKPIAPTESMIQNVDAEQNANQVDEVEKELIIEPPAEQAQEQAGDENDSGNGNTTG